MRNTTTFPLLLIACLLHVICIAQKTPAANANQMADSLVFISSTISNPSLTYNPVARKYYSVRLGSALFPVETWNETGGLSIFQDTVGIDSRGIWWNPNTSQVERNCFNTIGWSTLQLDAGKNATGNFTMLFTGLKQPNSQSVGTYDFKTNSVLFYNAGNLHVYNRNTALQTSVIALTGTSLTNVNSYSVIYTGMTGFEVGLLDYVARRVLLFNRATGAFSGQSQLPASALTHSQFRFCYANDRVWLFNSTLRKWNSYYIWNEPILLPVDYRFFTARAIEEGDVLCSWSTMTEVNNEFFTIERSRNSIQFEEVGIQTGAGNSTQAIDYTFTDKQSYPGLSYYRIRQTDFDGRSKYSEIQSVYIMESGEDFTVFPNPVTVELTIQPHNKTVQDCLIQLIDNAGRLVLQVEESAMEASAGKKLQVGHLQRGLYTVRIASEEGISQAQLILH